MKFLSQLFWFSVSGILGLLIDTTVLYALKSSLGLYQARLISFLCAVIATWLLNRSITFRAHRSKHSIKKEFFIYLGLMVAGGLVNYGLYAWLIMHYAIIATYPVLGVAAGSLAGMLVNLCTSRHILFRFEK